MLLLFFEIVFAILLFAPIFSGEKTDPDALSRSNLDMTYRSPEAVEAEDRANRRKIFVFRFAAGFLLVATSAGIVIVVRKMKYS
jgi:hypothetical protein